MVRVGKAFSGGLGRSAVTNQLVDFQLWMCLRDWDWSEMRDCGVGIGQFACFRYDERSGKFVSWGTAEDLKLLSEAQIAEGMEKEDLLTNHDSPSPILPRAPACHDSTQCRDEGCKAWMGYASCAKGDWHAPCSWHSPAVCRLRFGFTRSV